MRFAQGASGASAWKHRDRAHASEALPTSRSPRRRATRWIAFTRRPSAPGIREHYEPGYHAAFARHPDGHRLKAVLHEPVG